MKEEELKLLNYQIISTIFFIVSLLISIVLTYDEKQYLLNKDGLFSEKFDKYLNLFNRILSLTIILFILYINLQTYEIQKNKKSNHDPFRHQVYASVISVVSSLIVLYVVIENWYKNPNITSIENPTI